MRLDIISRRLAVLESENCPHCRTLAAMSEEDLDARFQALISGKHMMDDLPEPSPSCSHCQRFGGMSEEELDAELARLIGILEAAEGYDSEQIVSRWRER